MFPPASTFRFIAAFALLSTVLVAKDALAVDYSYSPQEGDIVFQRLGGAELLEMIAGITQSDYTHCGIVARGANGKWKVIEAIGPVREVGLDQWISAGDRGGFAVYQLKEEHREAIPAVIAAARKEIGKPYDIRYRFDDEKIYCSELVFKAYRTATGEKLGNVKILEELNWEPFKDFIKELEQGPVPLKREIITPLDLALADQLEYKYHHNIIVGKKGSPD